MITANKRLQARIPILNPPNILQLTSFLAHAVNRLPTTLTASQSSKAGSLVVASRTLIENADTNSFQEKNLSSVYDHFDEADNRRTRSKQLANPAETQKVPRTWNFSHDQVVQTLKCIFAIFLFRECALAKRLQRQLCWGNEMIAIHTQEIKSLKGQLELSNKELRQSEDKYQNLASQLKNACKEHIDSDEKHVILQGQFQKTREAFTESENKQKTLERQLSHIREELMGYTRRDNEAAASHAQLVENLKDQLVSTSEKLAESEEKNESLEGQLEYTRDELRESENKNEIFTQSLALFQEEDKSATDLTKKKGPNCTVCATKSNELRKLRRANHSMAEKLVQCRVVAENNLNKMAEMNATAEGTTNENGIAAKELLGKREVQIKLLKEELSDQAAVWEQELDSSERDKARMSMEVDRLTGLHKLRNMIIAALKEENRLLRDSLNKEGWRALTQYGAVTNEAQTAHVEALEALAEEKLRELMVMRIEMENMKHRVSELEHASEGLKRAKALAHAEVDKATWIAEVRKQELENITSRHVEELQERDSIIESLKRDKDDIVKSIPPGLDDQARFLLETKGQEIEALQGKIDDLEDEIERLEEKNRFSHTYANVYEMLHAELGRAEECRNIREVGRAKLDRLLRKTLEGRYGVDVTQDLYAEALESMSIPEPEMEGEVGEVVD